MSSNLKRHHDTNHRSYNRDFHVGSRLRKTKLKSLKEKLHGQSRVMSMFTKETDLTTEAGFILAFNIAQVISVLEPENKKLQKLKNEMPVARHTTERRIYVISAHILNNLHTNSSKCLAVSLALDESTDIKATTGHNCEVCVKRLGGSGRTLRPVT